MKEQTREALPLLAALAAFVAALAAAVLAW